MPLAVTLRRQFQAQTLSAVANIEFATATEIVAQVRPSDGFSLPESPLSYAQRPPRPTDPKLSRATHAQFSADLHRTWQVVGLQRQIAKALVEISHLLEALQLQEWPLNQFLYDLRDTPYGGWSPTYLAELHRAPKFISHAESLSCMQALATIGSTVNQAEIQDLQAITAPLTAAIERAQEHLRAWRVKSAAHDGEQPRFDGVQPIEDEGVELLQQHMGLTDDQAFLLRDPAFDLDGAWRLKESIDALDSKVRSLEPVRQAAAKLRRRITDCYRRLEAEHAQRQPLPRQWDIWGIGSGSVVALGTVMASTSMKAIATAPSFLAGRVIAVPAGFTPWRDSQPALSAVQAAGEIQS
ncbi:MAG TPA: hypothetical protein VFP68_11655 [Burkholderiaceae bacterium]|nr:hypothetical protein [Burkholderiaceae bacterium]